MNLNNTTSAERIHISFFGKINSGKSTLINTITNQNVSIVSDIEGTTTDPVSKAMELLPLGAVLITDTAGYNDISELGDLRIEKTLNVLNRTDIAVLVTDALNGLTDIDNDFIEKFKKNNVPYIIVYNKCDLVKDLKDVNQNEIYVSALKNINIDLLKEKIASFSSLIPEKQPLISDLINENDIIFLVTPIDNSAPKGRLILPQQQVIRDVLNKRAICIVVQETQLKEILKIYKNPKLVITDSQVFKTVNDILPDNIPLTSFSIIFARYKGILKTALNGIKQIDKLNNNDTILISEGCTHHRQCEDIGTVKLPAWIKNYTKKFLNFEFTQGHNFPDNLKKYAMIIHCGGCMLNDKEVFNRFKIAQEQNIPMTNYGITIAHINNILKRSIQIYNILN